MKRQRTTWIPVLAIACLLAAGCSQEEGSGAGSLRVPLVVTSAGMQSEVNVTRSSYSPLARGSIGVFMDNGAGVTTYTPIKNSRYDYEGSTSSWTLAAGSTPVYLMEGDAAVCACYPYDAAMTDNRAVPLAVHPLADGEVPLAYSVNVPANATDKQKVSFSLNQAYAWLEIRFTRSSSMKDNITLSEYSVSGYQLAGQATLDITTGPQTNTMLTDDPVRFTEDIPLAKGATVTRNLLMVPPDLDYGLRMGVKISDKPMSVLIETLPKLLQSGYKYTVTVTVNGSNLGVSSVEVLPWTPITVNNSGNLFIPLP